MSSYRDQSEWTAEQVLAYIVNLEAVDDQNQYHAFATAYNYFMNLGKKKVSWSVHLEKLAYEFIQLAFESNKHSTIKDILKSYRSLTQGQYSESLKDVLEHYRDRKLQTILQEDILNQNIELIRELPNIESQEASSTIIFSSFKPTEKRKIQELRSRLKIVWQGYKHIIETVKINQKLENVFKQTLSKVFVFVEKYNRKHEFKSFCKTLKESLRAVLNKRDRTQTQKSIYIDIEKTQVNDRNIEIRLDQFKVTIKLGLWQEAFQVLEDINSLMRVRKGSLKSNIRYKYFENLSLLFKKSNYWHYHAFAFYNKYLAAQKNPKLTPQDKKELSDELLISVLCIPPVTLESSQSKESQQKISSMMISSTKIPTKKQLFDIIVNSGIFQNASLQVRNLWSFMILQFDLESLKKGLTLLNQITNENYAEFKNLIEDILIYRQLQSISEIYQRIKIDSLLSLIPLPRQKIEKILLQSYHQKILDFVLDEDQKIIIFEDKSLENQSNPTQSFFEISLDLAIEKEKQREDDGKVILKKLENFVQTSDKYYSTERQLRIDEYRKKLRKPKQELLNEAHRKKMQQIEQRELLEAEKLAKQSEAIRLAEEHKKLFGAKKIVISDINDIKQNRVVRILGKKVEELTDDEIQNITIETLAKALEEIKNKIQINRDARYKKAFNQIDYMERERRERLEPKIKSIVSSRQEDQKTFQKIKKDSRTHYEQQKSLKERISKIINYLQPKIEDETRRLEEKYDFQMAEWKQRLSDYYKQKIIARAKALAKQNKEKKELEEKKMRQAASQNTSNWSFKGVVRVTGIMEPAKQQETQGIFVGKKFGETELDKTINKPTTWARKNNTEQEKKDDKPPSNFIKIGAKKQELKQQIQPEQIIKQAASHAFVPPPVEKKSFAPSVPTGEKKVFGKVFSKPGDKKIQEKKGDDKPKPPAKKYVDVNAK